LFRRKESETNSQTAKFSIVLENNNLNSTMHKNSRNRP